MRGRLGDAGAGLTDAAGLPGDDLVPDANMVFDRERALRAAPADVWPWLVQLGKERAGWYLPRAAERAIPRRRRAIRAIDPRWQALAPGDLIPDYGGRDETLEAVVVDPPRALVYRSERKAARFSWALLLEPAGPAATLLRLRFRGAIKSTGVKRRAIVAGGDFFDWATSELMLRGLAERVEEP